MEFSYWIQHADLEAEEFPSIDYHGAIAAFERHNWRDELNRFQELEKISSDRCPPGVGFVSITHGILHLCPGESDDVLALLHFKAPHRVLGIFSLKRKGLCSATISWDQAIKSIALFFEGNTAGIRAVFQGYV